MYEESEGEPDWSMHYVRVVCVCVFVFVCEYSVGPQINPVGFYPQ